MCAGTDTNGTSTNADNAASWGQALWNGTNLQTFLRGGVQTDETGRAFFLSFGGLTYVGDVRNGKADGWGTMSGPTGINLYGQWRNGDPYILSGSITATNGTKETGTWNYDGSKCGGTINWADGRVYKGDWKLIPNGIDLPDGVGTMSVSPQSAIEAVATTLVFTYTAPSSGLSSGAVAVTVPSGWTAPSTTSGNAGYTTASTGTVSVASQVITVSGVTLSSSQTLTVTYGAGGGSAAVTPPTTLGNATFSTSERSSSSGTLTALSSSPVVSVVAPPDGTGTMSVSPTSALASVPTTLTFTYTAATDGLVGGSVVLNVPSGWTAPSTSSTHAGYTTASVGTLSVAGQVITVSGLTLSGPGQKFMGESSARAWSHAPGSPR